MSRHFSKEDVEMINKHVERSLISLILRDWQIETTIRYYLTPIRMATMKKNNKTKQEMTCWWDVEELEPRALPVGM